MDRARKGPVQPLRPVIIGPRPEEATGTPPPSGDAALTRLFRMTPQDPEVVSTLPSTVDIPGSDEPTLPRMEPVTRFFSSNELLSRAERLDRRDAGSGEFETVKRTRPMGTMPTATSREPEAPSRPSAALHDPTKIPHDSPASAGAARERPAKPASGNARVPAEHPHLWTRVLPGEGAARRIAILALAVAAVMVFAAAPLLRGRSAASATRTAHAIAPQDAASADERRAVAPSTPESTAASAAESAPARRDAALARAPTLERAAVDAVAEGRYAVALDLYRKLAGENPSQKAYRDAAKVLTARLAATP